MAGAEAEGQSSWWCALIFLECDGDEGLADATGLDQFVALGGQLVQDHSGVEVGLPERAENNTCITH